MKKVDVEAEIIFLKTEDGGRQFPPKSGYRPAHLIKEDYLTTGEHYYLNPEEPRLGETVYGSITFIDPESYPHCLCIGKMLTIQEGKRVVGNARITKILNPVLASEID